MVPLAKVGDVPALLEQCLKPIVSGSRPATLIDSFNDEGQSTELIAAGYQTNRVEPSILPSEETLTWQERILVVRSLAEAKKQFATLQRNLQKATKAILALTPTPGRGRRQIRTQAELIEKALAILATSRVGEYLHYTAACEESTQTRYIGRGRGSANRQTQEKSTVRYQITQVIRDEEAIDQAFCQMGWKLYATNQPEADLPLDEAVRLIVLPRASNAT